MPGKLNNSKINFIKEDTDEIHIDNFLFDNFIHDKSWRTRIYITSD